MPEEQPAIRARVPVGAMVVTVALRRGGRPARAGALVDQPGKGPRSSASRSLARRAVRCTCPISSSARASASGAS